MGIPPRTWELAPLALQNKKVVYDLLFHTSAATLLEVARDPKHLDAEIGFFSVLRTWDQKLQHHPMSIAWSRRADSLWITPNGSAPATSFPPIKVLSRVFRGKFVAALKRACSAGELRYYGDLNPLLRPRSSPLGSVNCSSMTGWSIANHPSVVPSMPYFAGQ